MKGYYSQGYMEKRSWGVLKKKLDSGISCGLYRSGEYHYSTCSRAAEGLYCF